MGGYLKDTLKDQYYPIGFDFNKGGFRSIDLKTAKHADFSVGEAVDGSSGKFFSQFNIPAFFIDIEGAVKNRSPADSFFNKKIPSRSIGAGFSTDQESWYYVKQPLYDEFDGLIFINQVAAAVGIR